MKLLKAVKTVNQEALFPHVVHQHGKKVQRKVQIVESTTVPELRSRISSSRIGKTIEAKTMRSITSHWPKLLMTITITIVAN